MHLPLYAACDWIADNDNASCGDFNEVRFQVTVVMVADLFRTSAEKVARMVLERRKKLGYIEEVTFDG